MRRNLAVAALFGRHRRSALTLKIGRFGAAEATSRVYDTRPGPVIKCEARRLIRRMTW
jgi:hypothetical protein